MIYGTAKDSASKERGHLFGGDRPIGASKGQGFEKANFENGLFSNKGQAQIFPFGLVASDHLGIVKSRHAPSWRLSRTSHCSRQYMPLPIHPTTLSSHPRARERIQAPALLGGIASHVNNPREHEL